MEPKTTNTQVANTKQDPELISSIKIANKLLKKWKLSETQKTAIWGCEIELSAEFDLDELKPRLLYILNIHKELRLLFNNPDNYYGYMTMINNNSPFNGKRPIDLACSGMLGLRDTHEAICSIGSHLK